MRRGVVILVILFLSISVFSQKHTMDKTLKLYTNFSLIPSYPPGDSSLQSGVTRMNYEKEINVFNFSPAIIFCNKKGNSHELELSRLFFQNNYQKTYDVMDSTGQTINVISGETINQFQIHIRYEYVLGLFKKRDWKKLNPSLGFSGTPFYKWYSVEPLTSMSFPESNSSAGFYISIIPRIQYNLSERWYLDLNIPVTMLTIQYSTTTTENPAVAINERKQSTINFDQMPFGFAVRFGLGFRI